MNQQLSIRMQKLVRGYLCRKHLREPKDQMTFSLVSEMLDEHKIQHNNTRARNNRLKNRQIRNPNFPSEVSENLVKFVLFHKSKMMPSWDVKGVDLQCGDIRIEVKAFSSDGPTSFGPHKKWDRIYFLDATRFHESFFKVYECKLKNTSQTWQELKMNNNETFGEQAKQGRRPRLSFDDLQQQLGDHCRLIWEGVLSEKLCDVHEPYRHDIYAQISNITRQGDENHVHVKYTKEELLRMDYREIQRIVSGIRKMSRKHSHKPASQKRCDLLAFLDTFINIDL